MSSKSIVISLMLILLIPIIISCSSKPSSTDSTKSKEVTSKFINRSNFIGSKLKKVEEVENELGINLAFELVNSYSINSEFYDSPIEIIIERLANWNDPGDFHRITIVIKNKKAVFFNNYGWVKM